MHKDSVGEPAAGSPLIDRVVGLVTKIGGALSALLIFVVLVLTAVNVVARYLLDRPIQGVDEATGFLVVAIVMAGAAEAFRRGDHIRIDLLIDHCGPRLHRWLEAWATAAVLLFAGLLVHTAWDTVAFSRRFGAYSTGYLGIPLWIPQSALVVGGVLLGLAAAARLLTLALGRRP